MNGRNEDKRPTDKRLWSETKQWFNSLSEDVQWGDLSEYERNEARRMYEEEVASK